MENKDKNLAWAGKNHNKKSKGGVTKTEKRCVLPKSQLINFKMC